jgi:RNA polymerase sigma-70 factor (ECF subfamily)
MREEELIRLAAQGDEDAFQRLFDLWFPKAYRVGKAICGCQGLAEDAVQEALIRLWHALAGRKIQVLTEGYFLRIVANESRRMHARRKAAPEEYLENLPGGGETPEAAQAEKEQFLELMKAVDALPQKIREAVKLHYYGGFSEAETAETLGISLSSAKMRLLRGREKLKTMLVDRGFESTGG